MFKELKKHVKNEKGLTLIELLAVIVILAIIAAIAIPAIGNIINNSRDKAILSEALNVISGAKIAYMDGQCAAAGCNAAVLVNYIDGVTATDLGDTNVVLTGNEWTITYPGFDNIKGDKYKVVDGVSERTIKTIIDPDAPSTTPPAGGGDGDGS